MKTRVPKYFKLSSRLTDFMFIGMINLKSVLSVRINPVFLRTLLVSSNKVQTRKVPEETIRF